MNPNAVHRSYLRTSEAIDVVFLVLWYALEKWVPLVWPLPHLYWLQATFGGLLTLAGLALILQSKRELARYRQRAEPGHETTYLVHSGVFAKSRNPNYLASVLLYVSAGFLFSSTWCVLMAPAAALVLHFWLILPEERYLESKFGPLYREYAAHVGRWWTF